MAAIIALVYPDQASAEAARVKSIGLQEAGYLKILDSVVVNKDAEGKANLDNESHRVRKGLVTGGVLGVVTGAIFAIPVAGLAAGAAVGIWAGKALGSGGTDDFNKFRDEVEADLEPGGAALVIFGETNARDRVINEFAKLGGKLHSTDFSDEQVAEIQKEIDRVSGN